MQYFIIELQIVALINNIINFVYAGYPTNEERMIVGLGLGGSGWDIDISIPEVPAILRKNSAALILNQTLVDTTLIGDRERRDAYGDGTRCPHKNSAGEVCQQFSGTSLTRLNSYAFIYAKKRMQYTARYRC